MLEQTCVVSVGAHVEAALLGDQTLWSTEGEVSVASQAICWGLVDKYSTNTSDTTTVESDFLRGKCIAR